MKIIRWQHICAAMLLIPIFLLIQYPFFSITGSDIFSTEDSGEGEFSVGSGSGNTGVTTGIPSSSETGTTSTSGGDDSGGGGGGGYLILEDILVIPAKFNLRGFTNVNFSAKIYLKNQGNVSKTINIDSSNLGSILDFNEKSFALNLGEEKILGFRIIPPSEPDIYSGKIILTSEDKQAEIPFEIRVVSDISLFDILLDIPKKIKVGNNIEADITLTQAGFDEKEDVALVYEIKNSLEEIVFREIETIAVQGTKKFEKSLDTQNLAIGDYTLTAEVIYSGGSAVASSRFEISESGSIISGVGLIIYLSIIFMILISIIIVSGVLYRISKEEEETSEYKEIISKIH